jgi:hypothetical protein
MGVVFGSDSDDENENHTQTAAQRSSDCCVRMADPEKALDKVPGAAAAAARVIDYTIPNVPEHLQTGPRVGELLKAAVNLTPHDIVVLHDDGKELLRIAASGETALLVGEAEPTVKCCFVDGLPIPVLTPDPFTGAHDSYTACVFPEHEKNVIVSKMAADWMFKHKYKYKDLTIWAPDTGPDSVVRDDKGGIKGVKRMLLYLLQ